LTYRRRISNVVRTVSSPLAASGRGGIGDEIRIGQAQGSTGQVRLETAGSATDPTMEERLEAPILLATRQALAKVGAPYTREGQG
jgi:hypothetical protein